MKPSTPSTTSARILIATDILDNAELVKSILAKEFSDLFVSTDEDKIASDFEQCLPDVLVLAFNEIEQSERYYLGLYRLCPTLNSQPHRTIILCNKDEVKQAYELCMKDYFDDYIQYWPMTYDTSRLVMSTHNLVRELNVLKSDAPSAAEFAIQARRIGQLEEALNRQMAKGDQHIEASSLALMQVERDVGTSLDGLSRRLSEGEIYGAVNAEDNDKLAREISRIKSEEIQQSFHAAKQSGRSLNKWAQGIIEESKPIMESARTLNEMADRVVPTVLVVDDDDMQHKIISKLLEAENYNLVFAISGIDAFNTLRKLRPDIILMDVKMPGMDGVEVARRIKASPHLASIPVIMITGNSDKKVVVGSLEVGACDFVVKPIDREILITKINQALSSSSETKSN